MRSSNMSTLLARIRNNKVCQHVKLRPNAHSIWLAVQHMWSCQGRSHRGSLLLRLPGAKAQCAPEQEKSLRQVASLTNRETCGSTTCPPRVSGTSVSQRCKPTRTCRHSQPTTEQHPPLSASLRDSPRRNSFPILPRATAPPSPHQHGFHRRCSTCDPHTLTSVWHQKSPKTHTNHKLNFKINVCPLLPPTLLGLVFSFSLSFCVLFVLFFLFSLSQNW